MRHLVARGEQRLSERPQRFAMHGLRDLFVLKRRGAEADYAFRHEDYARQSADRRENVNEVVVALSGSLAGGSGGSVMTIRVSRADVAAAAAGTLSAEEFRRRATVARY